MNHQLSKYQFRWEGPSAEQMLVPPWLVPEICTSQGTVMLRGMSRHKPLSLWNVTSTAWNHGQMTSPFCAFLGDQSQVLLWHAFHLVCFPCGFFWYSGWEERLGLGKKVSSGAPVLSQDSCDHSSRALVPFISPVWLWIQIHLVF